MASKFEVQKSTNGQFYFRLKAGNGEIILASELYASKDGAEGGIASVKANAPDDSKYERKTAKNGEPYFVLKAANGQTIGKSEMYKSAASMEKGIASVKANAPGAAVSDLT
jgi:uncharacterized protein YegP (UPF0339 family)